MLKTPVNDINIEVKEDSVVWGKIECPIVLKLSPNTSLESLTFFEKKYAPKVLELFESDTPLDSEFEIEPFPIELSKEFKQVFLMQVAKVKNNVVGLIDIPTSWLLKHVLVTSEDISSEEFSKILNPTYDELKAQIPKVVSKPTIPKKNIEEEDDEIESEEESKIDEDDQLLEELSKKASKEKTSKTLTKSETKQPSKKVSSTKSLDTKSKSTKKVAKTKTPKKTTESKVVQKVNKEPQAPKTKVAKKTTTPKTPKEPNKEPKAKVVKKTSIKKLPKTK